MKQRVRSLFALQHPLFSAPYRAPNTNMTQTPANRALKELGYPTYPALAKRLALFAFFSFMLAIVAYTVLAALEVAESDPLMSLPTLLAVTALAATPYPLVADLITRRRREAWACNIIDDRFPQSLLELPLVWRPMALDWAEGIPPGTNDLSRKHTFEHASRNRSSRLVQREHRSQRQPPDRAVLPLAERTGRGVAGDKTVSKSLHRCPVSASPGELRALPRRSRVGVWGFHRVWCHGFTCFSKLPEQNTTTS